MPATLDTVVRDALSLPPDERMLAARQILESVEPEPSDDAGAAWDAEIARRIAEIRAGTAKTVPAEEVFASARKIAPGR